MLSCLYRTATLSLIPKYSMLNVNDAISSSIQLYFSSKMWLLLEIICVSHSVLESFSVCTPRCVCSAELLHPMTMISSLGNGRVDWIQAEKWWSNPHIKWNSLRDASSIRCLTASSLLVMLQILIKMLIHGHFTVTTGAFQLSIYISQVPKSSNWKIPTSFVDHLTACSSYWNGNNNK